MSSVNKDETGRNGGKGGNETLIGVVVAIVIIVLLAVLIICLVVSKNKKTEDIPATTEEVVEETVAEEDKIGAPEETVVNEPAEKRGVVVTKDNAEDMYDEMSEVEYIEPGYYETSMTTEWHFANGSAVSEDAYVANVASNTNDIYFDVVLAEDEEQVIYASPVIPVGRELEEIALDTPLEAGSYDCVVIYHLVDENQNTLSTLRVGVTIIVEG